MSTTKKNSIILEGAAVYAVSLDSSLRRLQTEYDALMAAKRYNEAKGVDKAMRILRRLEVHPGALRQGGDDHQRLPHPRTQRRGRRLQEQPAPAGQGGRHPGGGRERGGRSCLRRKPDAGLGRCGTLPRQSGQSHRLGARGYPGDKEQMDAVRRIATWQAV